MNLWTYQLKLVADSAIPRFKRLRCHRAPITLADIFQRGIHPHSVLIEDQHYDMTSSAEVVLGTLNAESAYVAALKAHHVGCELGLAHSYYGQSLDQLDSLLKDLCQQVYFVEDLSYEELVEIAAGQLRKKWSHSIAREMVLAVGRDFHGIREFLKRKDPGLILTGYQSLDEYDLSVVLSVDDFLTEDSLLISHGLELHNFRRLDSLAAFTDSQGRVRLATFIKHCTIEVRQEHEQSVAPLTYRCSITGDQVHWQPDLPPNLVARAAAKQFAKRLGRGTGTYCFTCSTSDLEFAAQTSHLRLKFPSLRYKNEHTVQEATAKLKADGIVCYGEMSHLWAKSRNDRLQEVLRGFGRPVTGRKDELVQRLVELLAQEYAATEKEMDAYFTQHRFLGLRAKPQQRQPFAVLQGHRLRETLVTLYCLRHLRGNVVLDPTHLNQSVTVADLASAFIHGQVDVEGCFVAVV